MNERRRRDLTTKEHIEHKEKGNHGKRDRMDGNGKRMLNDFASCQLPGERKEPSNANGKFED